MFAYVIFDRYLNKLILNNDVQGEKIYTTSIMKIFLLSPQQLMQFQNS